jgi:subtilase family serine protease
MRKKMNIVVLSGALTLAAAALTSAAGPAVAAPGPRPGHPAARPLAGSVPVFARGPRATGDVAGGTRLRIEVWLAPRTAGAEQFATAVSTPGRAGFRHYLSPAQYTARFGASAATAQAVSRWLRGAGFTGVRPDTQRNYVQATGTASAIDAALGVRLRYYRPSAQVSAGRYQLRSNDRPVSVPAALAASILGVTGLDNAAPLLPLERPGAAGPAPASRRPQAPSSGVRRCSSYYGQHSVAGLPPQFGTTTFPTFICGYSARQIRAAYHVSNTATGAGQTIAFTELGLTQQMFRTLRDYAAASGMPAPSPSRYRELRLGRNTCGDPFNEEEQLDVESAYDMAPAAREIVVGGDSCNDGNFGQQGLFNAITAILDGTGGHPLAPVVSSSWGSGFEDQPALLSTIEHAFLLRAAAEGVGMFFSSGDISGAQAPADDPFAIAVGGTSLGLGHRNQRLFETGWLSGLSIRLPHRWALIAEEAAAGGGPSALWREPAYQQGVVPPALTVAGGDRGPGPVRSIPDISADADLFTGFAEGELFPSPHGRVFALTDIGGTSLAAPLVAGMVTDAQQGQPAPFGFLNPVLYRLVGSSALFDPLPLGPGSPVPFRALFCPRAECGQPLLISLDDQRQRLRGTVGQVALAGYDNITGVGTPSFPAFIAALRAAGVPGGSPG